MKSGFVAIVGKPNAGKSSLINALLHEKVSIISHKAQTTRNSIIGVLNSPDYQMVFLDTPGIHKASTILGSYMNKEAMKQADGVDVIYYLVDAKKGLDDADKEILEQLFTYNVPVFLLLNKIDLISKDTLMARIIYAHNNYKFKEIIPISALCEENLSELIKTTLNYFNDDIQFYPDDVTTNTTMEFRISELIREKILLKTDQEIPHFVACKVESMKLTEKKAYIEATIVCNRDTHKAIIIGHHGKKLQSINIAASKDISALLGRKVILSLFVKVEEDWMNKNSKLYDLGYYIGDKYE